MAGIDFSLLQPVDIGGQFLAGMQAAQKARLEQQQQAEKLARAQQMQQDVAAWQSDMSPERTAALLMNYPEIKEQITSSQAVLNEAAKRDRLDFASRALMLSRAGQTDAVKAMAQQRVDAYRKAGKEREAQEAEAMLKAWELDPRVGEGALALDIATADPKLYETMFGKSEMTSFQKDLQAAGIDPNSPEGKAKASQFVQLKVDPIVEMETPDRGKFVGPQSEYYRRYGSGAPAPQPKALPKVGEVRGGFRFNGGDPGNKANWIKVGGGSGNATGGFPAAGGAR